VSTSEVTAHVGAVCTLNAVVHLAMDPIMKADMKEQAVFEATPAQPTLTEDEPVPSRLFAPSELIPTHAEKEVQKQWDALPKSHAKSVGTSAN